MPRGPSPLAPNMPRGPSPLAQSTPNMPSTPDQHSDTSPQLSIPALSSSSDDGVQPHPSPATKIVINLDNYSNSADQDTSSIKVICIHMYMGTGPHFVLTYYNKKILHIGCSSSQNSGNIIDNFHHGEPDKFQANSSHRIYTVPLWETR